MLRSACTTSTSGALAALPIAVKGGVLCRPTIAAPVAQTEDLGRIRRTLHRASHATFEVT
jgi:hypothetical protein